jgi:ubiquitin C-terminal hydrolase
MLFTTLGITIVLCSGQVLVIRVVRDLGVQTPLEEPMDNSSVWPQLGLKAVLTHSGTAVGGHWVTYNKVADIWWKVDSQTDDIVEENPFVNQGEHTCNVLIFKE